MLFTVNNHEVVEQHVHDEDIHQGWRFQEGQFDRRRKLHGWSSKISYMPYHYYYYHHRNEHPDGQDEEEVSTICANAKEEVRTTLLRIFFRTKEADMV